MALSININGDVPAKSWGIKNVFNEVLHEGHFADSNLSRLEVFKLILPPGQIVVILCETNMQLLLKNLATTQMKQQELLRLMGVLILLTQFEFAIQSNLWSQKPPSPYEFAAGFGYFFQQVDIFSTFQSSTR
jgi:hypothetical protein